MLTFPTIAFYSICKSCPLQCRARTHAITARYHTVFNREHDAAGLAVNLAAARASGRASVYTAFVKSPEFLGNPSLQDRGNYVTRVYQQLLQRTPSADEVAQVLQVLQPSATRSQRARLTRCQILKNYDGSGLTKGLTWTEYADTVYASSEFKNKNCQVVNRPPPPPPPPPRRVC